MPKIHSLKDRVEAATAYLITGFSADKAAALCGVPARTIRDWTDRDWWPDVMAKAKLEKQDELDAGMTEVIHKSLAKANERIENGDPFVKKDGSVGYKPVSAKDSTMVGAILIDKRAMIRGEPIRRTETVTEADRLKGIQDTLGKTPKEKKEKALH